MHKKTARRLLHRWDALMEGNKRDGKSYAAFLRFAVKLYGIPADVRAVWRKNKWDWEKHLALYIRYYGSARTMEEMRLKVAGIRKITSAFPHF